MPINKAKLISLATEMNAILEDEDKYNDLMAAWNLTDETSREEAINAFSERYDVSNSLKQILDHTWYPRPGPVWMVVGRVGPDGLKVDISSHEDLFRDP